MKGSNLKPVCKMIADSITDQLTNADVMGGLEKFELKMTGNIEGALRVAGATKLQTADGVLDVLKLVREPFLRRAAVLAARDAADAKAETTATAEAAKKAAEAKLARDARLVAESAASFHLSIDKLELQNSDRLDFREVYIPALAKALEHAYRSGFQQGLTAAAEADAPPSATHRLYYTRDVAADAGLLREYIAQQYGSVLTYGGIGSAMERAKRLVKRLAKLAGLTFEEALRDVVLDYEAIADAEELAGNGPAA